MYYPSDFVLCDFESEDLRPNKGINVLVYKEGKFCCGTAFDNSIPPSLLVDTLDLYAHTLEADKVVVILEDGRKVSKKFTK